MGYNKIIISGDSVELYQYEKNISLYRSVGKRVKDRSTISLLSPDRKDAFSDRELGKRRDNAKRARMAFSRLVRSNLGGLDRPLLFTLTYQENETDLGRAYKDFTSFIQALRFRFGKSFKYIAVPEFQKRGAVHFHALFWGLSEELVFSERKTRFFAGLWARGFLYIKETDGNEKLSFYLAKYMSKSYVDPRLKGFKAYVASRNCSRPSIIAGISPVWPILDDLGLSPDTLLQSKEYMTQWLGRGRYKLFKLNPK